MDFKCRSNDGMGDDWPLTYNEVAPYYDKAESYIGVFGRKKISPARPMEFFCPLPSRAARKPVVKKACDHLNILCIPARLAILTKSVNGRAPCHYCGQCGRGCRSASNFSSSQVMIPPAMATGRFTLVPGAMAREIIVWCKDGKAQAVSYVDKGTRPEQQVHAPGIFMAPAPASRRACCSIRARRFPPTSGKFFRRRWTLPYDTVGSDGSGYFP